ncbi:MAG TPA: ABC transporter ATP-binding protein [Microlunatus sp.]
MIDDDVSFRTRAIESVSLFGLSVRMVWRVGPWLLIGLTGLLVLEAMVPPAQLRFTQQAVDDLTRALDLPGADPNAPGHPVLWFGLLGAALLAGVLIGPISGLIQALLGDRLAAHLSRAVLQTCNSWPGLQRFEDPVFADDLAVTRTRTTSALDVVNYSSRVVVSLVSVIGIAITLGGLHPLAPVLLIATQLPGLPLQWRYSHSIGSLMYVLTPKARRLEYLRDISVAAQPAKDVRLAGAHGYLRRRYGADWNDSAAALHRSRSGMIRPVIAADLLGGIGLAATYGYLVWAAATGRVGVGGLVMFSAAAIMLRQHLSLLGFDLGFLPSPLGFLRSVDRVLRAGPDLAAPPTPASPPSIIQHGIAFEDVHFHYPGQDDEILRGVTFLVSTGESLALVGGNGAGKTTVIKLLLRLYDPTGGRITLDGVDLREYDLDQLRRRIGVIFQDFGRYELTAGENIGLGDVDHLDDRSKISSAAVRGGAAQLISSLPDGLDTTLGRELGERELSGGQWQRIALSRAFMADSDLLVLDEPTAELDPRGEYEVFQRFAELTEDRMTILVSHRFSTVRMADRIVLLRNGVVAESGDHHTLLSSGGEYARMYRLQASQYLDQDQEGGGDQRNEDRLEGDRVADERRDGDARRVIR